MFDAESGNLKRTGRATHLVRQVSHSKFDTPAGPIDGYYIEIEHGMDMQYAQLSSSRAHSGPVRLSPAPFLVAARGLTHVLTPLVTTRRVP